MGGWAKILAGSKLGKYITLKTHTRNKMFAQLDSLSLANARDMLRCDASMIVEVGDSVKD